MRPPEFWKADASGRDSALALRALLTPLSWAYAFAAAHRIRTTISRHAPVPVICIGNLTVGGAGKTPISRAIRAKLGAGAHMLSRGYGGRVEGPLRVTPDMPASEVGDEPLLHTRDGAAWIARDRLAGALAAAQAGAHVIIMDDGFQNPTLAKDLSIVAVDPGYGVGNGQVFPADWLEGFAKPILHARLEPSGIIPEGALVAFAGLARPEKFFDTLTAMGAKLADAVPFPDHHPFSDDDLKHLEALAKDHDARLITTEKDAARLSPEWRARVAILPVAARFADDAALETLLAPIRSRMNAMHG